MNVFFFFFNCSDENWDSKIFKTQYIKNITHPFDITEFSVFLIITFLYFLQENNYFFFGVLKIKKKI